MKYVRRVLFVSLAVFLALCILFFIFLIIYEQHPPGNPMNVSQTVEVALEGEDITDCLPGVVEYAGTYRLNAELIGIDICIIDSMPYVVDYKFFAREEGPTAPEGIILVRTNMREKIINHISITYSDGNNSISQAMMQEEALKRVDLSKKQLNKILTDDITWNNYNEFVISITKEEIKFACYLSDYSDVNDPMRKFGQELSYSIIEDGKTIDSLTIEDNSTIYEVTQESEQSVYTVELSQDSSGNSSIYIISEGKELQLINLNYHIHDIEFLDVNLDGYIDMQLIQWGALNDVHYLYLWDPFEQHFLEVMYQGFDMLSYYVIHDGYLINWAKESQNSVLKQKLIWDKNILILESEEYAEAGE